MAEIVTTTSKLLVQVITGGRPNLKERHTAKLLNEVAKVADVEWCIREDHVDGYELDEFPMNVYTTDFANEFARTHWRHPVTKWEPGGFFGAFPGREWACRSAAERGYDAVIQLDDNIVNIGPVGASRACYREGITTISEQFSILAELSASTNASMLGFQLNSVVPRRSAPVLRPGYPYSLFIEKVGPGRLPYYGPFEDDIMHALEYSLHGGPQRTAAVIDSLTYKKDHASKTGMRGHYNPLRGLEIARRYRKNVKLVEAPRSSSPVETERGVRHHLNTRGFSPVRVIDRDRYTPVAERLSDIVRNGYRACGERAKQKMTHRASTPA